MFLFQFIEEMVAAWQMTVDMRLGLFESDQAKGNPLAVEEGKTLHPNPPFIAPHNVWTKVWMWDGSLVDGLIPLSQQMG